MIAETVINLALWLPVLYFDHGNAPSGAGLAFDSDGSGVGSGDFDKGIHGVRFSRCVWR